MDNNENNQSTLTPEYSTTPSQPPVHPKRPRNPALIIAIIVGVVGLIGGLIFAISYLLGDGKQDNAKQEAVSATAIDGTAFMSNTYAQGARPLSIEGEAKALGVTADGAKVAIWRENVNDQPSELTIYDTASLEITGSSLTQSCTTWHQQDVALCAAPWSRGETPTLKLYSMRDASLISDDAIYEHPSARANADVSSLDGLDYLGESNGSQLFVVKASNSYLDKNDMTEEEAAKAANFFGLYTVSSRMIVGLKEDGSVSWSREIRDNDDCGMMSDREVVLCLDSSSSAENSESTVKTFNTASGEPMVEHKTSKSVMVASDGWIESEGVGSGDVDQNSSLTDLMKGTSLTVYGLDAKVKKETELELGALLGDMIPAPSWLPSSKVLYPAAQIIKSSASNQTIAANGKVAASSRVNQAGNMEIIRARDGKRITTGTVKYVSADGRTIVVLDEVSDATSSQTANLSGPSARLIDVENAQPIQVLGEGSIMLSELSNGLIVAQTVGDLTNLESMASATVVYVPGK